MLVNRLTPPLALLAMLLHGACQAQAPESALQSLPVIRSAAEQALRAQIDLKLEGVQLEAGSLDARLRLPACRGKLATFASAPRNSQARMLVRVSCVAPAWTLNVPVDVRRSQPVLVLRRAVARGEVIAPADVVTQTKLLPGLVSPFLSSADQLAGRLTRRAIPEGMALSADALAAALLIHRGQQVVLVAQSAGFEIRAPGRAMADAAANQRVRVQNLNSLKIVEGLADKDGMVRVTP